MPFHDENHLFPVRGGQGRSADDVHASARILTWLLALAIGAGIASLFFR